MDYNKRPQALITTPKNYATEVPTTLDSIMIGFNTDLDANFIAPYFRVHDQNGTYIASKADYDSRKVIITLLESLSPNTTYQVSVLGDSDLDDTTPVGIRNAFGLSMPGIFQVTFTTTAVDTLAAPVATFPVNQVVIKAKPNFSWNPVEDAVKYQIRLSKSNQMVPIIWPIGTDSEFFYTTGPLLPNIPMPDGAYYWMVRAWSTENTPGQWSNMMTFTLDTILEGTVSNEDTVPPEERIQYDPFVDELDAEVLDIFPKDHSCNVKVTLKTIYFQVLGTVTTADFTLEVIGESVSGETEDHGVVPGTIVCTPMPDGTTIIAFTPMEVSAVVEST
jgi:hypothetical protein